MESEQVRGRLKGLLDSFWAMRTGASRASNSTEGIPAMVHRAQLAAYDRCISKVEKLIAELQDAKEA